MGKGCRYFNGTCDSYHQHGHPSRYCLGLSEQDKMAFTARKPLNFKGHPMCGGKDQRGKWSGKGWESGNGFGNQQSRSDLMSIEGREVSKYASKEESN